eukprot:767816-Karenia_brevis.AAC.1
MEEWPCPDNKPVLNVSIIRQTVGSQDPYVQEHEVPAWEEDITVQPTPPKQQDLMDPTHFT